MQCSYTIWRYDGDLARLVNDLRDNVSDDNDGGISIIDEARARSHWH